MTDGPVEEPMEEPTEEDQFRWFKRMTLVKFRTMRRLTQAQVAEGIYRSRDSVRNYERGRAKIPATSISDIIRVLKMPDDVATYMRILAPLKGDEKPIEADGRFNALYLSLCEQFMGGMFEWVPTLFPGPLQTVAYQDGPARKADHRANDEWMESGRVFKAERLQALRSREDDPSLQFLMGEAAFFFLSKEPRKLQIEQLDFLTAHAELPGWELRVLARPQLNGVNTFSCFTPGDPEKFPNAGPKVVYTELPHSSWVFQDDERLAVYDELRHGMWHGSTGFKEYRDAYWRDRLA